jgi:hypothetical protein
MIELTKLIIREPLVGVVSAIAVSLMFLYSMVLGMQATIAEQVILEDQGIEVDELTLEMRDTLIRLDENVKHNKEILIDLKHRVQ